jgi:hypothetical protein
VLVRAGESAFFALSLDRRALSLMERKLAFALVLVPRLFVFFSPPLILRSIHKRTDLSLSAAAAAAAAECGIKKFVTDRSSDSGEREIRALWASWGVCGPSLEVCRRREAKKTTF